MLKNNSLLIWDSKERAIPENEAVVYWQSYEANSELKEVSVPQLVEDNADWFKSKYLELLYDLGESKIKGKRVIDHLAIRSNFSYWWMTLLSEKCNYSKSPQINNIIKIMAFDKWFQNEDYQNILLVSSNKQLADALSHRTSELGVGFEWKKITNERLKKNFIKRIYCWFPYPFQAFIWMIKHLIFHWSLKGTGVKNWKNSKAKITFISYLVNLCPKSLQSSHFESHYWTGLVNLLQKQKIKSNWLQIYIKSGLLPNSKTASSFIKQFNFSYEGQQVHVTLHSFLSIRLILSVLSDWKKLLRLKSMLRIPLQKKSGLYWPFFEEDYLTSIAGSVAMHNLLYLHLFEEAMSMLPKQKKGFYLKENQGWEFGFIHAWRIANHCNSLIGIPHTTVIYWDLRYFFDSRTYEQQDSYSLPLPNKVGVNGEIANRMYKDGGYPRNEIVKVEALRYLNLNLVKKYTISRKENMEIRKSLLILCDYNKDNVELQMDLLKEASKQVNEELRYIVKPHPACPILLEDYPKLNMELTNKPIYQLLGSCNLVFTSNHTSAAVDAYYAGKSVLTVLDAKGVNMSPLRDNADVRFISTPGELASVLNNMCKLKKFDGQRKGFFYLNPDLPRWKRLLAEDKK
ncbi:hypothetical protein OAK48_00325 [Deltaproteobacteria bacterium]|nr:hypothetical protein [Deltaproteobacteria bacterium]